MLILGFRVSNVLLGTVLYVCDVCGVSTGHEIVKRVRRLSVFFIPILPLGTSYRDVCSSCGRMLSLSAQEAERAASAAFQPPAAPPRGPGPQDSDPGGSNAWDGSGPQDSPRSQTPAW